MDKDYSDKRKFQISVVLVEGVVPRPLIRCVFPLRAAGMIDRVRTNAIEFKFDDCGVTAAVGLLLQIEGHG